MAPGIFMFVGRHQRIITMQMTGGEVRNTVIGGTEAVGKTNLKEIILLLKVCDVVCYIYSKFENDVT